VKWQNMGVRVSPAPRRAPVARSGCHRIVGRRAGSEQKNGAVNDGLIRRVHPRDPSGNRSRIAPAQVMKAAPRRWQCRRPSPALTVRRWPGHAALRRGAMPTALHLSWCCLHDLCRCDSCSCFPDGSRGCTTPDETVIHSTILLLAAGAAFQLFDGIQTRRHWALRAG